MEEIKQWKPKMTIVSTSNEPVNQCRLQRTFPSRHMEPSGSGVVRTAKLAIVSPIQAAKPTVETPLSHKDMLVNKRHELRPKPYLTNKTCVQDKIKFGIRKSDIKDSLKPSFAETDSKQKLPMTGPMKGRKNCGKTTNLSTIRNKPPSSSASSNSHQTTQIPERSSCIHKPDATRHEKNQCEIEKKYLTNTPDATRHEKNQCEIEKTYLTKRKKEVDLRTNFKMKSELANREQGRVHHSHRRLSRSKAASISLERIDRLQKSSAVGSSTSQNDAYFCGSTSKKLSTPVPTSTPNARYLHNQRINSIISMPSTSSYVKETRQEPDILDVEMTDVSTLPSQELINGMQEPLHKDQEIYYFVVDTNVLLSDLKEMNEVKDLPYNGANLPHIYIPWIVLQELDRLKTTSKMKQKSIEAIKYINHQLTSKNPRFHGQSAKMSAASHKSYDECNDDIILSSCLQLQSSVGEDKVVLLTNDRNLSNKALVSGVSTHTMISLLSELENRARKYSSTVRKVSTSVNSNSNSEVKNSNLSSNDRLSPNERLELDAILCEIKMLLKCFLEPYLQESMFNSYDQHGLRLLPKPPCSLVDILDSYRKYWMPLFSFSLPDSLRGHFKKIVDAYDIQKRVSITVKYILSVLASVDIICKELLKTSPKCQADIEAAMGRGNFLDEQCRKLQSGDVARDSGTNTSTCTNANTALAVFNHIWDLINYLCGMTMDFLGKPHDIKYVKSGAMPSKSEFQALIANLYPGMYKIKKAFNTVLDEKNRKYVDVQHLYNYLVQFVPSLQIQAAQPPLEGFNIDTLKKYCFNKDNEITLKNGYQQLDHYFQKINECIHDPIWKQ